jgi:hypothetical protein
LAPGGACDCSAPASVGRISSGPGCSGVGGHVGGVVKIMRGLIDPPAGFAFDPGDERCGAPVVHCRGAEPPASYRCASLFRDVNSMTLASDSMAASTPQAPVPVMLRVVPSSAPDCSSAAANAPAAVSMPTATLRGLSGAQVGGLPAALALNSTTIQPFGGQRSAVQAVTLTTITAVHVPPVEFGFAA